MNPNDFIAIGKITKPHGLKGEFKIQTYLSHIDQAELLRGREIFVRREGLKLNPDEILNTDLIGFTVVDEKGKQLGTVKSVNDFGAGDIIDCGSFSFPYEDEFVSETNIKERRLVCKSIS